MSNIKKYLDDHSSCRPEWKPLGKHKGENDQQHLQRLKTIFVFDAERTAEVVSHVKDAGTPSGGFPLDLMMMIIYRSTKCSSAVNYKFTISTSGIPICHIHCG
jgi:hypothetical protein